MKLKTRPLSKKRIPTCPRCGARDWRKSGLVPTNTRDSPKGWKGHNADGFHKEAVERLFSKRYVCRKCGQKITYGNAGRPITQRR